MEGNDKLPWIFSLIFFILTATISYLAWKSNYSKLTYNYNKVLEGLCLLELKNYTRFNITDEPEETIMNLDEMFGSEKRMWKVWRNEYNGNLSGFERKIGNVIGVFSIWDGRVFKGCGYAGEGSITGNAEKIDCGFPALISEASDEWFNITQYSGNIYLVILTRGPSAVGGILSFGCIRT